MALTSTHSTPPVGGEDRRHNSRYPYLSTKACVTLMERPCSIFHYAMKIPEVLYGEDAQALRKKSRLTQTQLAERWGLTRQQIGRYEKTGQRVPAKEADAYRGLVAALNQNAT